MALVFCDGFEQYSTASHFYTVPGAFISNPQSTYGWHTASVSSGTLNADSTVFRTSQTGTSKSLKINSNSLIARIPSISQPTLFFGFGVQVTSIASSNTIFGISDSTTFTFSTQGLKFRILSSGAVDFFNESTNVSIVSSSTGLIAANTWYYIELKIVLGLLGTVEARINESVVCTASNVDTLCGCSTTPYMHLMSGNSTSYFDDFYICDNNGTANNDYLGAIKVFTLYPNGSGATNTFPTLTGAATHSDAVNSESPNTTSYLSSSTVGEMELFTCQSLPSSPTTIYGVQVNARHSYDSHSTNLNQKLGVRSPSANELFGAAKQPTMNSWLNPSQIFETDADGFGWSSATVNTIQIGIKNS